MASRSRKRAPQDEGDSPERPRTGAPYGGSDPPGPLRTGDPQAGGDPPDSLRKGYARGRARDEAIRAGLEPLAPGERPRVVTVAAIVAFVFAVANAVSALLGNDVSSASGDPSTTTVVVSALLLVTGVGMLRRQYWAVLAFQTILGIQIVFFSLFLIGVQRWWHALVPLAAIGLLGWLFWKLVRPMARLRMPDQQSVQPGR